MPAQTVPQAWLLELLIDTGPALESELAITVEQHRSTIRRKMEGLEHQGKVIVTKRGGDRLYEAAPGG